jgi:hypothetical protein
MGITASVLRDSRYAPCGVDTRNRWYLGCIRHGLRNAIAENETETGRLLDAPVGGRCTVAPPRTNPNSPAPLHSTTPNPVDDDDIDDDYISCVIPYHLIAAFRGRNATSSHLIHTFPPTPYKCIHVHTYCTPLACAKAQGIVRDRHIRKTSQ